MKKLLMSVATIGIALSMLGAGTFAYFSDTETIDGNTFSAGTLDLRVGFDGTNYYNEPASTMFTWTNMAPCEETSMEIIYFKNVGTMDGYVTVDLDYGESDDPQDGNSYYEYSVASGGVDVSAKAFAKRVWITWAESIIKPNTNIVYYWAKQIVDDAYGGDWASAVSDKAIVDPDGDPGGTEFDELPTVYGLSKITLHFWDGYDTKNDVPISPGEVAWEKIKAKLDPNVGNDFQFDGIEVIITATLQQDCSTV